MEDPATAACKRNHPSRITSNSVPAHQAHYSDSRYSSWLYATALRCLRASGPCALRSNTRTSLPRGGGRHLQDSTQRINVNIEEDIDMADEDYLLEVREYLERLRGLLGTIRAVGLVLPVG